FGVVNFAKFTHGKKISIFFIVIPPYTRIFFIAAYFSTQRRCTVIVDVIVGSFVSIEIQGPFVTFKVESDSKEGDWTGLKFSPDGKMIMLTTNGAAITLLDAFLSILNFVFFFVFRAFGIFWSHSE
uniref:WD_REPEATS_REGION domain-containing protein n=1 Tax=Ascaris lumbricoides TaxID=6252 RepID=A0A0M3HJ92_ASCLU